MVRLLFTLQNGAILKFTWMHGLELLTEPTNRWSGLLRRRRAANTLDGDATHLAPRPSNSNCHRGSQLFQFPIGRQNNMCSDLHSQGAKWKSSNALADPVAHDGSGVSRDSNNLHSVVTP